jgi:hypothetical protein
LFDRHRGGAIDIVVLVSSRMREVQVVKAVWPRWPEGAGMQRAVTQAEQRAVLRFLEVIVRDAFYMADLTSAFLKAHGFRARKSCAGSKQVSAEDTPQARRAKGFLLNLAAALRVASWDRAGFRPSLPADLPTWSEAVKNAVPPETPDIANNSVATTTDLPARVFRTWLQRFSRSSRATLNTDVLLSTKGVSEDDLLDALAELLWANRRLADVKEG